jgi:hypothetical protein
MTSGGISFVLPADRFPFDCFLLHLQRLLLSEMLFFRRWLNGRLVETPPSQFLDG